MSLTAIVSYDDTPNDRDALALGRVLAAAGAELTLAYVRHSTELEHSREALEAHAAEALLERGALALDDVPVDRRVVLSPSTGEGLRWLAEHQHADLVVFGSDYRTASGHVAPGRSAQTLLEGGPAAVAIAPAHYGHDSEPDVHTIGVIAEPGDNTTLQTAYELAERLDATLTRDERRVDLLVVGSRFEAPAGRVMITSQAEHAIENATSPVLVLARGVALRFAVPAAA
jgi:nucleotide-binding universal stress UspA family protein